ncbi:hypothetical protein [Ramlibacter sp.]|uniref:hypothetical protein n=1 Tax=Ramlibacter sp. TaxID=1917967 RepID=UPI002BA09991|nr:hypothetical protein [Ramlibacter sp.]HWI80750.1 hypothetical protein [Ramlibacter sp.]
MNDKHHITAGTYRIAPLTRRMANGWYACAVSVRCASGAGSRDRLLRLTRLFQDPLAAIRYATAEGLRWLGHPEISRVPRAAH